MKVRFPLYLQILLLFVVNLVVVLAGLALFLNLQYGTDLDSLFNRWARNRLISTTQVLAGEMRATPPAEWPAILKRYDEAYGVEFLLADDDGRAVFEQSLAIPADIREAVDRSRWGRRLSHPHPAREAADRPRWTPVLFLEAEQPPRYWAAVKLPVNPRELGERTVVLLIASKSRSAGGLFFDPLPWVWVILGTLLVSALIWLPFVRSMTGAIARLTRTAERIADGNFDTPPSVRRRDELGVLAGSVTEMSSRLKYFVTEQRRFLGAIAHELASPIARARLALGIAESKTNDRQALRDTEEELDTLAQLVNELLSFSKASLQKGRLPTEEVALRALVQQIFDREVRDAETRNELPEDLSGEANPEMLSRALGNIVRNAARYAGADGPIICRGSTASDGTVCIEISDTGPGIPPEHLDRIFEPFYRPDTERTREAGGSGLGLAIARTCVESFGASIELENIEPHGLVARIRLREPAT